MSEKTETKRRVYRLPPCPSYDVDGMESWLSAMAEEGLFLAEDGFFAGVAAFERGAPKSARYRLEAEQKSGSIWSDYCGQPDPEQVELSEKYDWSYVGKRGEFYIYRSFAPGARELNTDPAVQALALGAVKGRRGGAVFCALFWFIAYPLLLLRGGIIMTMLGMGTWVYLLAVLLALLLFADAVAAFVSLGRLQKRLRTDAPPPKKNRRKAAALYYAKNFAQIALIIALVCITLHGWSRSVTGENRAAIDAAGEMPFATMRELAGENAADYRATMTGMTGMNANTVREWSDWLAPECIDYNEHARITLKDGGALDGGLYVDYYRTVSPAIAKQLAGELFRTDSREKDFEEIDIQGLDADYAAAYYTQLHFPTVLIRKGSTVVRAYFYQTSDSFTMDVGDWAAVISDSIA